MAASIPVRPEGQPVRSVPMTEQPPDQPSRKPRVAVVFGGRSTEHAVSCISAGSVLAVIDRDAYDVVPIGISHDGRWVLAADEPGKLAIHGGTLPQVDDSGSAVVLSGDPTQRGLEVREAGKVPHALGEVDVVLPLLHGPYGEDGTIQGLLELAGVAYVGSGVFASAAAMDKGHMKALLTAAGVPVGPHAVVTPRQWATDKAAVRESAEALGYPLFVKPCRAGSSVGISKVHAPDGLDDAIERARSHDPRVVLEAAIEGREIECGVLEGLDGGAPEASVPAEVIVGGDHEFYDFEAKYLPDEGTELAVPANLHADVAQRVRDLACLAFDALSCEGLARVDFFVQRDGTVVLNEVNTMPGFTPVSMFPLMWKESGLDYPALVDRLLQTALRRPTGLR
ncbi:MAG: D-alanine-D-alanine ligase [Actinomycetota bacterium]|jgi:D-alanine-D-alanine ligase|nr:D-alanine-D-alanine ligase [Actinomycetota bacterium]